MENAPCPQTGYIKRWDGYFIEAEQSLECTSCYDIIPSCMACTSDQDCIVCSQGYREAQIYSSDGIARPVCLKNFCGVEGFGSFCTPMENDDEGAYPLDCRKASKIAHTENKKTTQYYDCEQCRQGYYRYVYGASNIYYNLPNQKLLHRCRKQESSITRDFFV